MLRALAEFIPLQIKYKFYWRFKKKYIYIYLVAPCGWVELGRKLDWGRALVGEQKLSHEPVSIVVGLDQVDPRDVQERLTLHPLTAFPVLSSIHQSEDKVPDNFLKNKSCIQCVVVEM